MTLIAEPVTAAPAATISATSSSAEPATQVPAGRARDWAQVAGSLTMDNLPGRDLDAAELLEMASSIAADPSSWRGHVAFSDDQRHYVSLHRDIHVDVWVLCWTPQNDTGWHDHDISGAALRTEIPAGRVYSFGPEHIHRLTGLDAGSVSIHAYSPPLWRMGQYSVTGGMLRRKSVSYADELRPLDDIV